MDTSAQYIKMCEKAPKEITEPISVLSIGTQEVGWEYRAQILYCTLHKRFIGYDYTNCPVCGEDEVCEEHWIRLPRQDQLQEMSGFDWRSFDKKCLVYEHTTLVPTKEQAGMRVVMNENYNAVWDGEDWQRS